MFRCPRCQSNLPDDETQCPVCLKKFSEKTEPRERNKQNPEPPRVPQPSDNRVSYVGFWRRLGAAIPDLAIAAITALVIYYLFGQLKIPHPLPAALLVTVAFYLLLYSPIFLSSPYRATPGKLLFGIVVVYDNGKQLPFSRALVRELGKYISLLTFGLGFVIIGFTRKKQGLHDLLALTIVVHRSDGLVYQRISPLNPHFVRARLRLAAMIISICIVCSVIPLVYFGTMPSKTISPRSFAAQGLSSAADTLASSNYPEYSLEMYNTAIELEPRDPGIQLKKLTVLDRLGRVDEAQDSLEKMIVMYPNETTPLIVKGDLLLEEGKFQDALSCYEKAIAADPKNARLWIKKGDAHLLISMTGMQTMRGMYRNLTARSAKNGQTGSVTMVDSFQATQPYQDAVKAYNKAIELDPMTSVAISGRILSSTENLIDTYQGILDDM
nr:RDD family protein [uncultured Methanoregula sp.]